MIFPKKKLKKKYNNTNFLDKNFFVVYGLGKTGVSVIKFFTKKKITNFIPWDDEKIKRYNYKAIRTYKKKNFEKVLDKSDYIVLSPGINIKQSKLKKKLIKNKDKIITDIDLFYILNPNIKSIVVTGSNGKSTTCKVIEHVLKKNKINVKLGGNIGEPILDLKFKKNSLAIIEASSFQLEYSKFIKPTYAMILNITNDHLNWHETMKNYTNSKFKIFSNQTKNDLSFLNKKKLISIHKKNNFRGKLKFVSIKKYQFIKRRIKNFYLKLKINDENMSFAYEVSKKFNINTNLFIKSINSFKGLEHRHEIFYKKKGITLINDSKATSFEATKYALMSNQNIYWVLGGLPKKNDYFYLNKVKKKIIKAYIIGKNISFFERQIKKKVPYTISKNLHNAFKNIYNDISYNRRKKITILLSPAAASFDQFRNFEHRGQCFKKIFKKINKKL